MTGVDPTPGNQWRLDRAERDIATTQSELRKVRDSVERVVQGQLAEIKTTVALLQAGMTNLDQKMTDTRAEIAALRQEQREAEREREESEKVASLRWIAFITSIALLALGSLLNLARS